MNLKQFVENHAIVILFVTLVTGFAAGWGAYVAVQNAAGLTPVSNDHLNDHLKELERRAAFGREDLERENGIYRERIANLETENKKINDAWCADCEEKRTANGGEWPEDCGSFLGLKVLCVACYDLAKLFNLSNKTLDECRH
jgi:hypothetical protein